MGKWGLYLVISAGALLLFVGAVATQQSRPKSIPLHSGLAEEAYANELAKAYQETFDDLSLIGENLFGVNRSETSKIERHIVRARSKVKGYDFSFSLTIFGNKGMPLNADSMENRYSRWADPSFTMAMSQSDRPKIPAHRKEFTKQLLSGKNPSGVLKVGNVVYVLRPVRLSKKECLSCHTANKLNDPIAIMEFVVGTPMKMGKVP